MPAGERGWPRRMALLPPPSRSLEEIQEAQAADGTSIGMLRPERIDGLVFEKATANLSAGTASIAQPLGAGAGPYVADDTGSSRSRWLVSAQPPQGYPRPLGGLDVRLRHEQIPPSHRGVPWRHTPAPQRPYGIELCRCLRSMVTESAPEMDSNRSAKAWTLAPRSQTGVGHGAAAQEPWVTRNRRGRRGSAPAAPRARPRPLPVRGRRARRAASRRRAEVARWTLDGIELAFEPAERGDAERTSALSSARRLRLGLATPGNRWFQLCEPWERYGIDHFVKARWWIGHLATTASQPRGSQSRSSIDAARHRRSVAERLLLGQRRLLGPLVAHTLPSNGLPRLPPSRRLARTLDPAQAALEDGGPPR